jgi:hypothetical protein
MADQIILTKLDEDADRILDAFAERTGLEREDHDEHAHFALDDADDHEIDVVQTLTDIDEDWTDHVGVGDPDAED